MKKLLLCGVLAFVSWKTNGQTAPYSINADHNGCCGGGPNSGSSFLTSAAGQIDSIKVFNRSAQDYFSGNVISVFQGNTISAGSLLHSEDAGVVRSSNLQPEVMIRLAAPVHVAASTTYTFYIQGFPTRYGGSNTYANGTYWTEGTEDPIEDLDFILYIGQITTTAIDQSVDRVDNYILYKSTDKILEASSVVPSGYELSLYDNNGNMVSTANNNKLILTSMPQGMYIARLKSGNMVYTNRIAIQ